MEYLMSSYFIPYVISSESEYDRDLIKFIIEHYDSFMQKQFHIYTFNRYLSDFKYKASNEMEEDVELQELV